MWHCRGSATATVPRRAPPHPSGRQLGDLVPFPKGFLLLSFSCWLCMGPAWLGACSRAGFWAQQGVLILLGRCGSAQIQPCPQEQSSKAMAWQDPAGPGAASRGEAALAPQPGLSGVMRKGMMAQESQGLGSCSPRGRERRLCGYSAGWAGKGGGGCVLPRRTVLWIQLPWKLRCCPRCC